MKYGLLQGLGQGMAQVGALGLSMAEQKAKQQWMEQYDARRTAQQWEREDAKESEKLEREKAEKAVSEKSYKKDGILYTEQRNAAGEIIGSKESPLEEEAPDYSHVKAGKGWVYDARTGSYQQFGDDGLSEKDKKIIDSLNSDIKALRGSDFPDEDQIFQLEQQRNRILGLEVDDSGISPARDRALMEEAKADAENWASSQAGLFSSDKTDFKDYGGNRQEAINQKTLELYQQKRSAITGTPGLLRQATTGDNSEARTQGPTEDMPDPAQHKGRMIRDEETGKMYKSDGKTWKPV